MTEDDTLQAFIRASAERYSSGARAARDDALTLCEIASLVVAFIDELAPLVEKLDVARDQPQGGFVIRRSAWGREMLAECMSQTIGSCLLSNQAAALLDALVDAELTRAAIKTEGSDRG